MMGEFKGRANWLQPKSAFDEIDEISSETSMRWCVVKSESRDLITLVCYELCTTCTLTVVDTIDVHTKIGQDHTKCLALPRESGSSSS